MPRPAGPFALLVTNNTRQGAGYDVLLVDVTGRVVAHVTARLPLLKPHQTVSLPLAAAGSSAAYYLDGDSTVRSVSAGGSSTLVKSIPAGTTAAIAFAVSPDEQRIAVSEITQQADDLKASGYGYIEDLHDAGGRADIFRNSAADAYRWPVAWYQARIVDAIGAGSCIDGGYGYGYGSAPGQCARSLHVIDAGTQNRTATLCEAPTAPPGGSYQWTPSGLPTPAGVACYHTESTQQPDGSYKQTCEVAAVDLSGASHTFTGGDCTGPSMVGPPGGCALSPDGSRMACLTVSNQALVFLAHDGSFHNLGRRYSVLGWLDATHLMVDIDATTLAVLNADTGVATNVAVTGADRVDMLGVVGARA